MFSWLPFWKHRAQTSLSVRMYTRQGCHLCETAWRDLQAAQEQWGFRLEAVDVDADPELVSRYGDCVPVVTFDDKLRFRGAVNPVLLRRLLEKAAR